MELWDAYDKDGKLLGFDLKRGEKIDEGILHLVVEIAVKHIDGTYLLMQRSKDKESYPEFYEVSAGGAVLKGETSLEGAIRELYEETGIKDVVSIERVNRIIKIEGNYIFDSYKVITDIDKTSITFQEGETQGYKWLDRKTLVDFLLSDESIDGQSSRILKLLETGVL